MTVGELIDLLMDQDHERLVVLAKDAEGNGYSPLDSIARVHYEPETTWSGELTPYEDVGVAAILLEPVN